MQDYRGNTSWRFAPTMPGAVACKSGWRASAIGDPKVDPVDWVERIPFMETRNTCSA